MSSNAALAHPGEDPGSLQAVTLALPPGPTIDPVALVADDGCLFSGPELSLASVGVAGVLDLPHGLSDSARLGTIRRQLAAIPCRDGVGRPGSGVVALGALPFDPAAPARLLVPHLTYGRAGDAEWVTVVGVGSDDPLGGRAAAGARWRARLVRAATRFASAPSGPPRRADGDGAVHARLTASPGGPGYARSVASAVARIDASGLEKVVLARCVDVALDPLPAPAAVLERLHRQEPDCTVFTVPVPGGRFLGASPELLVSRRGRTVVSCPLAGTIALGDEPGRGATALLASGKDQSEHRYVVEDIARALSGYCETLSVPEEPAAVLLHSVAHLATRLEGTLRQPPTGPSALPSALDLLGSLHPTPAVGGTPRGEALALIAALEPEPRGFWAGPVGWLSADGDGDWFLGIRSALLNRSGARLLAGAGIVSGSDPAGELAETTIKLRPVLEALAPGSGVLLDEVSR